MANFSALKTAIQNAIKQNGNEEITGDVLQQILLSIVSTMGDGAINTIEQSLSNETQARQSADNTLQSNINSEAGVRQEADTQLQNAINAIKENIDNGYVYAGIATPSSTPVSGKVFYIATAAGTYTNFGAQVLTQGINILRFNGSAWSNQQLIGIDDVPTAGSNSLVKSGGVQNELVLGAVYDVSAKNPTGGPNNDGKWESLSALLSDANLNTLIPTAYRKGGMSIKFVRTYDNKYVQYFCKSQTFTTDVTAWGKMNLEEEVSQLDQKDTELDGLIDNGTSHSGESGYVTTYYPILTFDKKYIITLYDLSVSTTSLRIILTSEESPYSSTQVAVIETGIIADRTFELDLSAYKNTDAKFILIRQSDSSVGVSYKTKAYIDESIYGNFLAREIPKGAITFDKLADTTIERLYPIWCKKLYKSSNFYGFLSIPVEQGGIYLIKVTSSVTVSNEYINLRSRESSSGQIQEIIPASTFNANTPRYALFTALGTGQYICWNYRTTDFDIEIFRIDKLFLSSVAGDEFGILGLNPHFELSAKIQDSARGSVLNGSQKTPCAVFCWFTDVHYDIINTQRVIQFADKYKDYIDDIIHTGDMVYSRYDDSQDSGNEYYNWWHGKAGADKVLNVIGNHDVWLTGGGYDVSAADAYSKFIAPFVDGWNVTHDGNTSHCYYYKDYATKNVRLIVLDCMHWDATQLSWLQSTLAGAKTIGLSVIVANHYAGGALTHIDCSFDSIQNRNKAFTSIDPQASAAIDDFITNGGEFVCWICGHQHTDYFATLTNYPNQLCIALDTAKCISDGDEDGAREMYTKTQDCFNILSIDTYAKILKIVRVGNDYDSYLRHKGILTYNYGTHQLIQSI